MKISYKKLWVLLMIDHSQNAREVAASTKRKEKLQKQLKECRDYDEMIAHLALSRIELDLDDGVKVNYRKLQTLSRIHISPTPPVVQPVRLWYHHL